MELEIKQRKIGKLQTLTGLVSFLVGLISLAVLNVTLLLKTEEFPAFFLFQLPLLGFFLGVIGLFTRNRSRLYAWWGIGLNCFILVFTILMFILAYTINAKP